MNAKLSQLNDKTLEVVKQIDHVTVDELLELIELRDEAIMALSNDILISEEDKKCIQTLKNYDSIIMQKMNNIMKNASDAINKMRISNMQRKVYDSDAATESYFIDKKK